MNALLIANDNADWTPDAKLWWRKKRMRNYSVTQAAAHAGQECPFNNGCGAN